MAIQQQSATIFQFPVGGRAGIARLASDSRRAIETVPAFDWRGRYHAEAIEEAEKLDHH